MPPLPLIHRQVNTHTYLHADVYLRQLVVQYFDTSAAKRAQPSILHLSIHAPVESLHIAHSRYTAKQTFRAGHCFAYFAFSWVVLTLPDYLRPSHVPNLTHQAVAAYSKKGVIVSNENPVVESGNNCINQACG